MKRNRRPSERGRWYLRGWLVGCLGVGMLVAIDTRPVAAQQVNVGVPFHRVNDSFFENYGVGFGFNRMGPRGGFFFNNGGGPNVAAPPFGGHNPANDFRFGMGGRVGGGNFSFNFAAGQGSSRSISSVTPSVTVMNGAGGFFSDTTIRPFVTGIVPVVGGWPRMPQVATPPTLSPLAERLYRLRAERALAAAAPSDSDGNPVDADAGPPDPNDGPADAPDLSLGGSSESVAASPPAASVSSAARGDMSVAEIRQLQQVEQQQRLEELHELIRKAEAAEAEGKTVVARIYYERAARRAEGELRDKLVGKIRELK